MPAPQRTLPRKLALVCLVVLGINLLFLTRFSLLNTIPYVGIRFAASNPTTYFRVPPALVEAVNKVGFGKWFRNYQYSLRAAASNRNTTSLERFHFDRPVEDAAQRRALPEVREIPGFTPDEVAAARAPVAVDTEQFRTWTRSHGDQYSSKFSQLTSINKENVGSLEVAWQFDSSQGPAANGARQSEVQANPIVADGTLFATTPENAIVALDARSGELRWVFKSPRRPAWRGMVWWPGDAKNGPRLYVPFGAHTLALDAKTGLRIEQLGEGGFIATGESRVAPLIDGDRLLVAIHTPAQLSAYSLHSGEKLWSTATADRSSGTRHLGGSPWAGMALDSERGVVYVSTGNPRPALLGVSRPGPNPHSDSVVALDTKTGSILWAWQEVAHDLWDFDIPAPPILTTITRFGKRIDIVAVVTKIGNTLVLDRDTGRPIFKYRLRRAPTSKTPGEVTATHQPHLELPTPLLRPEFKLEDVTDIGSDNQASVRWKLAGARFGFFEPPVLGRQLISFGLHGGAEWPGAAVNMETGILYVPINRIPWELRLYLRARGRAELPNDPGRAVYKSKCIQCHGNRRDGNYSSTREVIQDVVPSLVGISMLESLKGSLDLENLRTRHSKTGSPFQLSEEQRAALEAYFGALDTLQSSRGDIWAESVWGQILDKEGYPASKPPWGEVVALDLNTGREVWRKPFGEFEALKARGIPPTGQPNYGGLIVTKGGLVFATGTVDRKLRAFDSQSGEELWSYQLPAAGSAPPATYEVDGQQFVTVMATGGKFHGFEAESSTIITFKLPDRSHQ